MTPAKKSVEKSRRAPLFWPYVDHVHTPRSLASNGSGSRGHKRSHGRTP